MGLAEEHKKSHCMANTIKKDELCYKDGSLLGMKPFKKFCAKDEKDYKRFYKDQFINFLKYSIKTVTSYLLDVILEENKNVKNFVESLLKYLEQLN